MKRKIQLKSDLLTITTTKIQIFLFRAFCFARPKVRNSLLESEGREHFRAWLKTPF